MNDLPPDQSSSRIPAIKEPSVKEVFIEFCKEALIIVWMLIVTIGGSFLLIKFLGDR